MSAGLTPRSPTTGLLIGLIITLAAVAAYALYITAQISDLQGLQGDLVDRNRRDSLQLLRIQNDLNLLAIAMRDMLDGNEPYPVTAWENQFDRLRADLEDALRLQGEAAGAGQPPAQREYLRSSMNDLWDAVARMFARARAGDEDDALTQVRYTLQARQAALSSTVARLLVQNNAGEEAAAERIGAVYAQVRRQALLFLGATLVAILATGIFLIRSNRMIFDELSRLAEQRSDLARALITTQESTLRHISRDLHDEFGQVLTAVGALLERTRRRASDDTPLRADLEEVRLITQTTLDNVRTMSQALHPTVLDEGGLESALEWLVSTTRRRTGLDVQYAQSGSPHRIDTDRDIHVYRIAQEALNNIVRHAAASRAWVRLRFAGDDLELEIEDAGRGFSPRAVRRGIGLIAMRERAELLGGTLALTRAAGGGTVVRLRVPGANDA